MSRRGGVLASVLALGLFLLVWVSSASPVSIIRGGRTPAPPPPPPTPSATTSASPPVTGREFAEDNPGRSIDLSWIGDVLTVLVLGGLLLGLVLGARWLWRNRWHPPEKPVAEEFSVLPEANLLSEALARDIDAQFAAVMQGTPRNGIVECWLRLEMAITEAGLPPHRWETSAEFTVRVLKRLDVDPRAIGELSRLYREARFSEHELGEEARVAARSALQRLHSDLQERSDQVPR